MQSTTIKRKRKNLPQNPIFLPALSADSPIQTVCLFDYTVFCACSLLLCFSSPVRLIPTPDDFIFCSLYQPPSLFLSLVTKVQGGRDKNGRAENKGNYAAVHEENFILGYSYCDPAGCHLHVACRYGNTVSARAHVFRTLQPSRQSVAPQQFHSSLKVIVDTLVFFLFFL